MEQQSFSKTTMIGAAAVILIVGLTAGYYYGSARGAKAGRETGFMEGKEAGIAQQRKAQEDLLKKAAGEEIVNPAAYLPDTNPLKEAKTNPYEGVYKNPFR